MKFLFEKNDLNKKIKIKQLQEKLKLFSKYLNKNF